MSNSIIIHLLYGPHSGFTIILIGAIILTVRAFYYDVFIDESESAPSEEATEKHGIKATKVTRPIMIGIPLLIAAFAIWKLWQP
jgi:hypothetical protein